MVVIVVKVCVCVREVGWLRGSGASIDGLYLLMFVSLADILAEISLMLIVHAEFMLGKSPVGGGGVEMKCTAGLLCKMFIFIQSNTP